jgi:hypothetical protein
MVLVVSLMKTVPTFRLLLVFIVCVSTPLLANGCKTVEGKGFGTALDPVTVDYNMLMPDTQASSHPAVELEDESGPKMEAFYKKLVWAPYNCFKGSTLRHGISAYWFPTSCWHAQPQEFAMNGTTGLGTVCTLGI